LKPNADPGDNLQILRGRDQLKIIVRLQIIMANQNEKVKDQVPDTPEEEKKADPAGEAPPKKKKQKDELGALKEEMEKLKNENAELAKSLKAAQDEAGSLRDQMLRLAAEFDNFKKRTQKEKEQMFSDATAGAVAKLLPTLDNLERALDAAASGADLKKGVEMTYKQLTEAFAGLGVRCMEIEPGSPFDPQYHNAVMHVEDDNLPENSIAEVMQKGYVMGDKVIRHAMVKSAN